MPNICKWLQPQKRSEVGIWEPKPPKVGPCWLAAQHYYVAVFVFSAMLSAYTKLRSAFINFLLSEKKIEVAVKFENVRSQLTHST